MVMQCSDECSYIREYKWILSTADDEEIPYQDKYFPFGTSNQELSLSPALYEDYPDISIIHLSGTAITFDDRQAGKVSTIEQKERALSPLYLFFCGMKKQVS
ncbi:hypothetical protein SK128_004763 [Halocaridina rubra]|uniref:Uncharacterized protein n=1 Tax=Halocaridina rubra TaxID=373956 RepID=A0AAN8WFG3_HALRR